MTGITLSFHLAELLQTMWPKGRTLSTFGDLGEYSLALMDVHHTNWHSWKARRRRSNVAWSQRRCREAFARHQANQGLAVHEEQANQIPRGRRLWVPRQDLGTWDGSSQWETETWGCQAAVIQSPSPHQHRDEWACRRQYFRLAAHQNIDDFSQAYRITIETSASTSDPSLRWLYVPASVTYSSASYSLANWQH